MEKHLNRIAAAAILGLAGMSASAVDLGTNFNVSVTFTSSCSVAATVPDIAMTYTAFATAASTGSTSATFTCTRGLTPSFRFDSGAAGVQTASAAASTGTITAEGVIKGLRYTLSAAVPTVTAGTAASAGANGTGGSNGTADTYAVTVNATIPAGQAGDPTGANSQLRTLYIVY